MSKNPDDTELRRVERAVLKVYREENPSVHFVDRGPEDLAIEERKRERLFRDYLKFPPRMFHGARFLDFGCGTGERAIFYSRWGARCTLVDMNPLALERARKIFSLHAPEAADTTFLKGSLFDAQPKGPFDIVGSEGVLHHTAAKREGFAKLVSYLRPGGFVFLGLGNRAGFFQRNLQRLLLYRYTDTEAEIEQLADRFFTENLDRAERFGRRSRRAIIFDTYVNPRIDTTSMAEILDWFRENQIRFYSSWPPMTPLQFVDVPDKGVLKEVTRDSAVIVSGGVPVTLKMPVEEVPLAEPPTLRQGRAAPAQRVSPPQTRRPGRFKMSRKTGENEWVVSREAVLGALEDMGEVLSSARLTPVREGATVTGFP